MIFLYVVGAVLVGSVGVILLAAAFLLFPNKTRQVLIPCLISYATGTLLAAALLGLLPHALESLPAESVLALVLSGIVLFFVLEKLVIWRHCHRQDCEIHSSAGPLILVGDALHNFIDGVVIAAAFSTSVPLGIETSIAVIAHELPQEVGDFAILLSSGYSRARAFFYNAISSLSALVGAVLTYWLGLRAAAAVPYIMALSAASFIYIAMADLIPGLHHEQHLRAGIRQFGLLLLGVATIVLLRLGH